MSRVSLNRITNAFTKSKTKLFLCLVLVPLNSVRSVRQGSTNSGRQVVVAIGKFLFGGTSYLLVLSVLLASCHPYGA